MNIREVFSSLIVKTEKVITYLALAIALAGALTLIPVTAYAQNTSLTVQFQDAFNAEAVHKGDTISGRIASPSSLAGDTIEGKVTQVKSAGGQSLVQFTFDSIRHAGVAVPITAQIQGVSNSKGQQGADDQGQQVTASNIPAKAAAPSKKSRFGAQFGGLVGGRAGEVTGDAADDTSEGKATPAAMQIAAQGSELQLAAGATIMLAVRSNGSPDLASLTPNAPANTAAAANPGTSAGSGSTAAGGAQPIAASASAAGGQPELKTTKIEFVPGERTIFFDDFSDMVEDEPPPHWKVREGTVELRTGAGIRELYAKDSVNLTSSSFVVPQNFTFELEWTGTGEMDWRFKDKDDHDVLVAVVRGEDDGMTASASLSADENLGHGDIMVEPGKPVIFAMWAQQGRVRAYLNGQRVVDTNQVKFADIDHIFVGDSVYRPNGLRSVRVAESAPDFSAVINASGKYVTHGINFDTDSDHLKPESSAVLKQIAAGLAKNPNLKLEIDGYTDSVGDGGHNIDLSKRRALAVQSVLVSQFGIDAGRLTSNGFGAAKPIGSNDTPDGRAANRRVEFLKK